MGFDPGQKHIKVDNNVTCKLHPAWHSDFRGRVRTGIPRGQYNVTGGGIK